MRSFFLALVFLVPLSGCTQTLTDADCSRYRDRLKSWADKKGRVDPGAGAAFMKSCVGSTVSRKTATCLESATDESVFVKCLE